jgi:hypothetical protein
MRRLLCALLCVISLLGGPNFKLYLNDGNFQLVREYKVENGRVRYYSVERSDWEEMPVALVDLKKTEGERAERAAVLSEEAKLLAEEDKAVQSQKKEITKIPQDPGLYSLDADMNLRIFKQAESKTHNSKGRFMLKVLSPIPLVPGKATVELDGEHSAAIVNSDRPDLFFQLSAEERFSIIKLTPQKGVRIAQHITIVPVTKEIMEEMEEIEIFRKQLTESGLFKIWPTKPLVPGEYAVIQYTAGKLNAQIWDFAYKP